MAHGGITCNTSMQREKSLRICAQHQVSERNGEKRVLHFSPLSLWLLCVANGDPLNAESFHCGRPRRTHCPSSTRFIWYSIVTIPPILSAHRRKKTWFPHHGSSSAFSICFRLYHTCSFDKRPPLETYSGVLLEWQRILCVGTADNPLLSIPSIFPVLSLG